MVQATGAPEGDLTAASVKAIDADGPIQLVEAAKQLGVQQYIMVTSLGTGKFGLPAGMQSCIPLQINMKLSLLKAMSFWCIASLCIELCGRGAAGEDGRQYTKCKLQQIQSRSPIPIAIPNQQGDDDRTPVGPRGRPTCYSMSFCLPTFLTALQTGQALTGVFLGGACVAILNLFGGVLTQKRRAEVALEQSGVPYVIVRPGGMERPTDAYKRTHNVRLAKRDKLFGGQVSRLQVAELIACAVADPELAENKARSPLPPGGPAPGGPDPCFSS